MKKRNLITISIIIGVIILSVIILNRGNGISKQITMCIANNSELYIQLGCHTCKNQEKLFGENYQYLNVIDCWFEKEKCLEIRYIPTWIINNEKYTGLRSIEELKELTGCN